MTASMHLQTLLVGATVAFGFLHTQPPILGTHGRQKMWPHRVMQGIAKGDRHTLQSSPPPSVISAASLRSAAGSRVLAGAGEDPKADVLIRSRRSFGTRLAESHSCKI